MALSPTTDTQEPFLERECRVNDFDAAHSELTNIVRSESDLARFLATLEAVR